MPPDYTLNLDYKCLYRNEKTKELMFFLERINVLFFRGNN